VSGIVNVEITPELAVRLASAYATTLRKGSTVVTARDHSRAARALKRAVIAAATASAIDVRDLECQPLPVLRLESRAAAGGIMIRTTAGIPDSVDISFLDGRGTELSQAGQRKLDRIYSRQSTAAHSRGDRRAHVPEPRAGELRAVLLLQSIDTTDVTDLRVVIDAGGERPRWYSRCCSAGWAWTRTSSALVWTSCARPETADRAGALERLTSLVASSQASFGVYFGPVGERLAVVDETGRIIDDSRALLVFLDLIAARAGAAGSRCR
jgi:mannose-1-phosphate guanylyltransferase/phosphomannomutase